MRHCPWACVTDQMRTTSETQKYGHRTVSIFQLELNHLQDLLLYPSL